MSDDIFNCVSLPQRISTDWSDTVEESNSLGISLTVGTKLGESFSVSVTTSFDTSWRHAKTESESTFVEVRPGEVGWLTRSSDMQQVSGTYELIFKNRFYGHRYWYVPFEATGPLDTSSMSQRTRPMTDEERAAACP